MAKFFDLSLELHNTLVSWPGDTRFARKEERGTAIVSKLTMSSHSGTHVDAPKHFLFRDGGSVDEILLSKLVGRAKVVRIDSYPQITFADVKKIRPKKGDKLLFKTRNERLLLLRKTFTADYVSLSLEAARFLAAKKIDLAGVDYFGIEKKSAPGHPVHKTLLRAGVVIVEGLNLSRLSPGVYDFAVLPLKIKDGDGGPARAVAWR